MIIKPLNTLLIPIMLLTIMACSATNEPEPTCDGLVEISVSLMEDIPDLGFSIIRTSTGSAVGGEANYTLANNEGKDSVDYSPNTWVVDYRAEQDETYEFHYEGTKMGEATATAELNKISVKCTQDEELALYGYDFTVEDDAFALMYCRINLVETPCR